VVGITHRVFTGYFLKARVALPFYY